MPHICHISTTFNLRSGSARRTSAILKGCLEQGYKVSLIIGRDHDVRQEDLPEIDIFVVPELLKYIAPFSDLIVPWKIRTILKQIKPDLVHTHLAKAGISGRLAAVSFRIPCVIHTVHGPTFPKHFHPVKRWAFRLLERFCGRFTDRFVFVGHEVQAEYLEAKVCLPEKADVIQTGRPDAVFERAGLSESGKLELRSELCGHGNPELLIVTVGRLVPSKQLEHSIRIVKALHLQHVPAHLAIVGKCLLAEERQYEEELIKLARDFGVQKNVHFCGFRNDIIDIMEAADVVLLTSRYEGLPNVAVEAVISGTPMVTYEVSGVQEILKDGVSGWIVPQGDMDQIVDRIMEIGCGQSGFTDFYDVHADNILHDFRESVMVARKILLYERVFSNLSRNWLT
ncbi:MAG: glycosyltransferase [Thermodesulfobacteriota bacterium]|nr:glycosyltransferase [Thermodesulfobacteriota bacterium]